MSASTFQGVVVQSLVEMAAVQQAHELAELRQLCDERAQQIAALEKQVRRLRRELADARAAGAAICNAELAAGRLLR